MTFGHATLFLLGLITAAEACWALLHPASYRRWIQRALQGSETPDSAGETIFFWTSAVLLWVIAAFGGDWAHRILLAIGIVLMLLGFASSRTNGLTRRYIGWLTAKPDGMIRSIGLIEGAFSSLLIFVAHQGW